jgi:hypothetical protein
MRIPQQLGLLMILVLTFGVFGAAAQNDQQTNGQSNAQTPPTPPAQPDQPVESQPPDQGNQNEDSNVIPAVIEPNLQAPNGAGAFRPAFELPPNRSYILPRFDSITTYNSNGTYYGTAGENGPATLEYLLGGVTVEKVGGANELSINYLGGRSFSADGDIYNSTTQQFGLKDRWIKGRWTGTLWDQLYYSSDTYFGGGVGGPGIGIPGSGIQPGFNPSQGVVVGRVPILDNSSLGEVDYQASQRGTLTFIGSYTMLHYYGSGLINNYTTVAEVGYNYQLSHQDSIAVQYLYEPIRFGGYAEKINDNVLAATYIRHIRKRMIFQIGAGPEVSSFIEPGVPSTSNVSFWLTSSLAYQFERTSLTGVYSHTLTGGSGVFLGSETDLLMATLSRQLTRYWSLSLNLGYSHNSPLAQFSSLYPQENYDTVYGGGGFTRQIGHDWRVNLSYQGTYQNSNHGACTAPCAANFSNQQVIFGVGWHPRGFAPE